MVVPEIGSGFTGIMKRSHIAMRRLMDYSVIRDRKLQSRQGRGVEVVQFADMTEEERIRRLEQEVAETRKMLFGTLLFAKEMWAQELSRRGEGLKMMEAIEEAEESFLGGPQKERFTKFEHSIGVIHRRAKTIFDLISYISRYEKKG